MTIVKDGTTYDGVITDVSSMADESNGLFKIKAELPEANSLSTGSTVKVTVTSERAENVMTVLQFISVLEEHPGDSWIKKYIFPGVMLLSLWEMISCGSADGFYILDVENLRLHQILFTKGINNDLSVTRWY